MWYVFFFHPFSSLIWSLRNLDKKIASNLLWMFITYLGCTWSLIDGSTSDSVKYMSTVSMLNKSDYSFREYYLWTGDIDFFSDFLTYVISRFTDSGWILMIFQAFIFGFFFSRNMSFVFKKLEGRISIITGFVFLVLFMVVPIWNINGFRFWTATHIFIFGLFLYFFEGNKKSLIWCFSTPFVFHYAFIVPVLILSIFLLTKNRLNLYFGFFVFSLFFSEFDVKQFNNVVEQYVPEQFDNRSSSYRTEQNVEQKLESENEDVFSGNVSWYAVLYNRALVWAVDIYIFLLYFRRKVLMEIDPKLLYAFSFVLLFMGFANLLSNLPSGSRYLYVPLLLVLSIILIYVQKNSADLIARRVLKMTVPFLMFFLIVVIRIGFYFVSISTIFGNPVVAIFTFGNNIPLDNLIK